MEFFLWCWLWDKRVLCGLRHGKALFIWLWIIPFMVSVGTPSYTALTQYRDAKSRHACNQFPEVKDDGETLQFMVYLEESMLFMMFLASLGMMIKTRNLYQKYNPPSTGKSVSLFAETRHFDYTWKVRQESAISCIGLTTVFLAVANYAISIAYVRMYILYTAAVEANGMEALACELPGSWVILTYCALAQVPLGTLCCLIYFLAFLFKGCPAIGFICPGTTTKMKKCLVGLPAQFSHYDGEFDFDCDLSVEVAAETGPPFQQGYSQRSSLLLHQQEDGPADLSQDAQQLQTITGQYNRLAGSYNESSHQQLGANYRLEDEYNDEERLARAASSSSSSSGVKNFLKQSSSLPNAATIDPPQWTSPRVHPIRNQSNADPSSSIHPN